MTVEQQYHRERGLLRYSVIFFRRYTCMLMLDVSGSSITAVCTGMYLIGLVSSVTFYYILGEMPTKRRIPSSKCLWFGGFPYMAKKKVCGGC